MNLNILISYFIPKKHKDDSELERKSKFIIWFVFIATTIGVFFAFLMYFQNPNDLTNLFILLFFLPLMTLGLFHFRKKGSFIFSTHFFCGTFFIAMIFQPAPTGGLFSPDMPTIYIIPIFAMIMGSVRTGLFYGILALIVLIAYLILGINETSFYLSMLNTIHPSYFFFNLSLNLVVILFLVFRNENLRQKLLGELKETNVIISEKSAEITNSITYAKRLQEAILPAKELINKNIPNNFILYKPKDIVAGDFYWFEKINDKIYIAAADSTGHGVPGAMISVVCSNALNRSVKEFGLTETGKILDKTSELVLETFEKSSSEVKDGMDISLLCIDSKNRNVFWSGANNPLWYIEEDEFKEIKADKQPIGKTEYPKPFTTHKIDYKENTIFYLFTDGFADQFGGPKGKKFKYKPFADLLLKHKDLTQAGQSEIINKVFMDWKGKLEQVDDVCVIGIKL